MPTLAELRTARETAGADVIRLRDQGNAAGFVETPEYLAAWDKASNAYTAACDAEQNEARSQESRARRDDLARQVTDRAASFERQATNRLRPDYTPAQERSAARPIATAEDWARGIRIWSMSANPNYVPNDEDAQVVRRCGINTASLEVILPNTTAQILMTQTIQDHYLRNPRERRAAAIRQAVASLNTMTPEGAGNVAQPPTVIREVEINKLAWGGLLQVATIRATSTGEELLLPFTDDTSVKGRRIAEDGPLGTEKNPKFGLQKWGSYKYTSDLIIVTYEMLRDSFFDLEGHIGFIGGERLGKIENYECTVGTGNTMPAGIVPRSPVGVTTASPTAIVYNEVIDLEMSVDDAYIQGDRVGYMMNKNTMKALRKLVDGQNRPLLLLGQETTSNRDELNGYPIFRNYDMDDIAALKFPMLFGDVSKYWIRRVGGQRLVRDPYTRRISNDQDIFAVVENMDGNLVNAGTAPVKKMQMHA